MTLDRVADVVRRGLGLAPSAEVSLMEISDLANINYVYRAEVVGGPRLYIKVVAEQPKRLPVRLPRERVFSEAEGLRRFRALAGSDVVIPHVLFVDREEMALGMSDVGEGRQVLFNILPAGFPLLDDQAEALGGALGMVHRRTRCAQSIRPPEEEAIVRKIIFEGLLAPGARAVFPETWDALNEEMQAHRECLVHGDLWSKNLLVREDAPIAIVDFEGVCVGDPAFDLGTLTAVALIPALEWPPLMKDALSFTSRMLRSWAFTCGSETWSREVLPRVFRATAVFLAARGFGPFAYAMSDTARARLRRLSASLATDPAADDEAFRSRVLAEEA